VVDGIIKPVLLGAVREALGPDVLLMLDPFHYYSRLEALDLAKGLERLGFPWMEELMDEHSMSSYVWLTWAVFSVRHAATAAACADRGFAAPRHGRLQNF